MWHCPFKMFPGSLGHCLSVLEAGVGGAAPLAGKPVGEQRTAALQGNRLPAYPIPARRFTIRKKISEYQSQNWITDSICLASFEQLPVCWIKQLQKKEAEF